MKRIAGLLFFIFSAVCIVYSQSSTESSRIKAVALENIIKSKDAAYKANYFQAVRDTRQAYRLGDLDKLIMYRREVLHYIRLIIIAVFVLFPLILYAEWRIIKKQPVCI